MGAQLDTNGSATEDPAIQLGRAIDRNRNEIERRWLELVQKDVVDRPGIELTQLRDGLPAYLAAMVQLLGERGGRDLHPLGESAWSKVAREHGVTRVRLGFDIDQLIHEFVALRHVIRDVGTEEGIDTDGAAAILSDVLDAAIEAAVHAYVAARDYQARLKQAEHIGFLTHELRNPLSTAGLAVAKLRPHATPEMLPLLDVVERSHRRLGELIESVLLAEKLEAGKIESRPAALRLGQVLDGALEGARAIASEKGLEFSTSFDPDLPVTVDPLLTRSAIQNLADNAAKYTDVGRVEVAVDDHGAELVFHVRDTCRGIAPHDLVTIFEPFERGVDTGKAGTGLGLAIARRAIEAQGGTIGVESPGPSGCHFWIILPKATLPH